MPGAAIKKATIANTGTTCPLCGVTDSSKQLELYFPEQPGKLLGFVLSCEHVIEADVFELALDRDEVGEPFPSELYPDGAYPVTIVDQATGKPDIIPVRVIDSSQR